MRSSAISAAIAMAAAPYDIQMKNPWLMRA
jgi:hypothetical protein